MLELERRRAGGERLRVRHAAISPRQKDEFDFTAGLMTKLSLKTGLALSFRHVATTSLQYRRLTSSDLPSTLPVLEDLTIYRVFRK